VKQAVRYRLMVGLANRADIISVERAAVSMLDYATVYATTGIYEGAREASAVVEVVASYDTHFSTKVTLDQLGVALCRTLNQESYGLTREVVEVEFVEVPK